MPSQKQCSKCNKTFECCADGSGCWCENYIIKTDTLAELKHEFDDCLCSECLSGYGQTNQQVNKSTN